MFIDPTAKILDLDLAEIKFEQTMDLPEGARVVQTPNGGVFADADGNVLFGGGAAPMKGGKPMTFGYLAVQIAMAQFEGDDKLAGEQKMDRFELAEKFHNVMLPVEISNAQAKTLLTLAEKGLPFLTYARFKRIVAKAESMPASAAAPSPAKANGKAKADKPAAAEAHA